MTTIKDIISNTRETVEPGFSIELLLGRSIGIGPVATTANDKSSLVSRTSSSEYLCGILQGSKIIAGKKLKHEAVRHELFMGMATGAVIGTYSVVMECARSDILLHKDNRILAAEMIREITALYTNLLPHEGFAFEALWSGDTWSPRLQEEPPIIIVEQARRTGTPYNANAMMMNLVIEKVEKRKAEIQAETEAQQKPKKEREGRKSNKKWNDQDAPEQSDRLELKRERKRARQLEEFGKQTMPKRYTSPSIMPLGKKFTPK